MCRSAEHSAVSLRVKVPDVAADGEMGRKGELAPDKSHIAKNSRRALDLVTSKARPVASPRAEMFLCSFLGGAVQKLACLISAAEMLLRLTLRRRLQMLNPP